MTNLKKIGLTALAGSLIASTAMAGSLSVSGGAKLSYTSKGGTSDAANGNRFGMQKAMTFAGGGELDNGNSVALTHVMTAEGGASSSLLTYDMGDMGSIMYTNLAGGLGIGGIDDLMPTAVEEPWDGLKGTKVGYASGGSSGFEYTNTSMDGLGGSKVGYANGGSSGFEYTNTSMDGLKVEIAYAHKGQGANDDGGVSGAGAIKSSSSAAVQYTGIDGANIFVGKGSTGASATTETDYDTFGFTYAMGAATVGVQRTDTDPATGEDVENTAYGVSFSVNDDLSISYGASEAEVDGAVDQEIKGFAVGYSMGGLTLQAHANEGDNMGNTANNYKHTELTVSFAF